MQFLDLGRMRILSMLIMTNLPCTECKERIMICNLIVVVLPWNPSFRNKSRGIWPICIVVVSMIHVCSNDNLIYRSPSVRLVLGIESENHIHPWARPTRLSNWSPFRFFFAIQRQGQGVDATFRELRHLDKAAPLIADCKRALFLPWRQEYQSLDVALPFYLDYEATRLAQIQVYYRLYLIQLLRIGMFLSLGLLLPCVSLDLDHLACLPELAVYHLSFHRSLSVFHRFPWQTRLCISVIGTVYISSMQTYIHDFWTRTSDEQLEERWVSWYISCYFHS